MADELKERLTKAVSAETSRYGDRSNLENVKKRARSHSRRAVATALVVPVVFAGALVSALVALDTNNPTGPSSPQRGLANGDEIVGVAGTQTDTAAAFAVRAAAQAGLLDPDGELLDYQGIETTPEGWTASFRRFDCSEGLSESCKNAENPRFEMQVVNDSGLLRVTGSNSAADGYNEEAGSEPSRLTYPTVEARSVEGTQFESDGPGTLVQGIKLWEGPLPAPGVIAECTLRALNGSGEEKYSDRLGDLEAPETENGRSGGIFLTVIPLDAASVSEVSIDCESVPAAGEARWFVSGDPELEVLESEVTDKLTVLVTANLVWTAEENPDRFDSCSAVLYDDRGNVLGHGTGSADRARSDERPLGGAFGTAIQVKQRPASVEVKC